MFKNYLSLFVASNSTKDIMKTGFHYQNAAKPCRLKFRSQVQVGLPATVKYLICYKLSAAWCELHVTSLCSYCKTRDREMYLMALWMQTFTATSCQKSRLFQESY